jgi:hypothetical protein
MFVALNFLPWIVQNTPWTAFFFLAKTGPPRARGADREELIAAPNEQHRLAVRVSQQHGAVGDFRERNSPGETGPREFVLSGTHAKSSLRHTAERCVTA